MSSYLRPRLPGATIFFTVCLQDRGSDLLIRDIAGLREAVWRTRNERPFGIDAWVVLPDHMHCIWRLPEGDTEYATRWRLIKARFSRGLPRGPLRPSQQRRGERGIWQRRFWEHHIRNEADHLAHLAYCRDMPVHHGLVEHAEDWPFSSFNKPKRPAARPTTAGACEHAPYRAP